ncbi:MAG: hypothetical protein OEW80_02735 [Gemmatimonadota bacterium]|nr:hypothetical protein [Gemmatimonadota bacterium]
MAWSAVAQESGKRKDNPVSVATATAEVSASVSVSVFSTAEKRALTDYYAKHPAGAKPLPPGIARNLGRGKPLPPGIAKTRLPADAQKSLPPREDGAQITIFGDKIVLLEASGLVVDILSDILR